MRDCIYCKSITHGGAVSKEQQFFSFPVENKSLLVDNCNLDLFESSYQQT